MALVHNDDEIEAAIVDLTREPGAGAVLLPDTFTLAHDQLIPRFGGAISFAHRL